MDKLAASTIENLCKDESAQVLGGFGFNANLGVLTTSVGIISPAITSSTAFTAYSATSMGSVASASTVGPIDQIPGLAPANANYQPWLLSPFSVSSIPTGFDYVNPFGQS